LHRDLPMTVGVQQLQVVGRVRTASAAPDAMVDLHVFLRDPQWLTTDHASSLLRNETGRQLVSPLVAFGGFAGVSLWRLRRGQPSFLVFGLPAPGVTRDQGHDPQYCWLWDSIAAASARASRDRPATDSQRTRRGGVGGGFDP
jgi:hypothetical protein